MAEHMSILKNYHNTYHPRFGFTLKTGIAFSTTGFCFYCVMLKVRFGELRLTFRLSQTIKTKEKSICEPMKHSARQDQFVARTEKWPSLSREKKKATSGFQRKLHFRPSAISLFISHAKTCLTITLDEQQS